MKINPHCLSCAFLPCTLASSMHSAWLAAIPNGGLPLILLPQKLGTFFLVAGLGLVLGMRHSTDADHVVAISTIVTRQRGLRGAALIGSLWGLGHTVTIFIVGCLIILGGIVIPPRIGLSMEFCVALMLILLGILNLTGVMARIVGRLEHLHSRRPQEAEILASFPVNKVAVSEHDSDQSNSESALTPAADDRFQDQGHHPTAGRIQSSIRQYGLYHFLRPLVVGLVHGLAGSAAIALLVLSTIHNPLWAVLYLIIFGVGTMLGMMCMTAAMSVPMTYAGDRLPLVSRYLGVASGLVSVCFGTFLVYQLGYVGGLFTSHPHWTPQ